MTSSHTVYAHSLPWHNPDTQTMNPFHRSHSDSDCGCSLSWSNYVSGPDIRLFKFSIPHFSHHQRSSPSRASFAKTRGGRGPMLPTSLQCATFLLKIGTYARCAPLLALLHLRCTRIGHAGKAGSLQVDGFLSEGAMPHWIIGP